MESIIQILNESSKDFKKLYKAVKEVLNNKSNIVNLEHIFKKLTFFKILKKILKY